MKPSAQMNQDIKVFLEAIDWIWKNRKDIIKRVNQGDHFDYPDYFDMPRQLHEKLSSDLVDHLQECIPELKKYSSKIKFANAVWHRAVSL